MLSELSACSRFIGVERSVFSVSEFHHYLILQTKSDSLDVDGILTECQNTNCGYVKDGFSAVYNQGPGGDSGVAAPTIPHRGRDKSRGAGDAGRNSLKTDHGCEYPAIARSA
jgi:hypothetical protein